MSSRSFAYMSLLISSPLIPSQWYCWDISLPRCGQKEEMRKEINDLNKACWKEWNAVCSLSRAIWSWMSIWCNSCLKWPFVHLFRHRSLQTGSNIYACLTSGVGLVSTQMLLGYPGFFLKCRILFFQFSLGILGAWRVPEPLAGIPMFCRQRSFSSFIKDSVFLYNLWMSSIIL